MEYVYILNICTTSISIIHFIHLLTLCKWNGHTEKMINTKRIYKKEQHWMTKRNEWAVQQGTHFPGDVLDMARNAVKLLLQNDNSSWIIKEVRG